MVIKSYKLNYLVFLLLIVTCKAYAYKILDFESEQFIRAISSEVMSVNQFNKQIDFHIISDENPNAYIDQNNQLYISSGLITNSPDYIAFLAVIAHEIGHLEKYHITKKKQSIEGLKSLNALGNLSILAGSMIAKNPSMIQALTVNQLGINNFYINFSKEQEREADYYSINTLNKLNLPTGSVIKLLETIEERALQKGITEEFQKLSTHPIFKERYEIINQNTKSNNKKIDKNLNEKFNFIKAKFIGYTHKLDDKILIQEDPYKKYSEAIIDSRLGNLKESLKKLNQLIKTNENNIFLIETKADILLSYGYRNEALKFYEKVFDKYPNNKYVQIRIFNNSDYESLNENKKVELFKKNINLLFDFPNNQIINLKYLKLSKSLNKINWINFLELKNIKNSFKSDLYIKDINDIENNINDENLKKLIKMHKSKIL